MNYNNDYFSLSVRLATVASRSLSISIASRRRHLSLPARNPSASNNREPRPSGVYLASGTSPVRRSSNNSNPREPALPAGTSEHRHAPSGHPVAPQRRVRVHSAAPSHPPDLPALNCQRTPLSTDRLRSLRATQNRRSEYPQHRRLAGDFQSPGMYWSWCFATQTLNCPGRG